MSLDFIGDIAQQWETMGVEQFAALERGHILSFPWLTGYNQNSDFDPGRALLYAGAGIIVLIAIALIITNKSN